MLTAENLFPKPVPPSRPPRIVGAHQPEDLSAGEEVGFVTAREVIMSAMKAQPRELFCATDFPGLQRRWVKTILKSMQDQGLIEPAGKRASHDGKGRPAEHFRWITNTGA